MHVPCSMTSVEPGSGPVLPSAFPDGVGLDILYAARSHGPHTHCLRFTMGSPLRCKTRFRLCFPRLWPGEIGCSRGYSSRFQFMTFSSSGVSLAHQGAEEPGSFNPLLPLLYRDVGIRAAAAAPRLLVSALSWPPCSPPPGEAH